MDKIVAYIPAAVSAILLAVLILTVVTNIIVQVLKNLTLGKVPTNIIAMVIFVALVGLMAISADATSNEYAYDDIASIEQILEDA